MCDCGSDDSFNAVWRRESARSGPFILCPHLVISYLSSTCAPTSRDALSTLPRHHPAPSGEAGRVPELDGKPPEFREASRGDRERSPGAAGGASPRLACRAVPFGAPGVLCGSRRRRGGRRWVAMLPAYYLHTVDCLILHPFCFTPIEIWVSSPGTEKSLLLCYEFRRGPSLLPPCSLSIACAKHGRGPRGAHTDSLLRF